MVVGVFIKHEVHDGDAIDLLQLEIPLAHDGLFLNGEGRIIQAAVFEIKLFGFL